EPARPITRRGAGDETGGPGPTEGRDDREAPRSNLERHGVAAGAAGDRDRLPRVRPGPGVEPAPRRAPRPHQALRLRPPLRRVRHRRPGEGVLLEELPGRLQAALLAGQAPRPDRGRRVTAHDRTPAPPLDEADLQAMEARAVAISPGPELSWQRECFGECQDVLALVAALRAAWRENARYRAALEEIALGLSALNLAREPGGVRFADRLDVLETRARAALAAPDTTSAAIPQSEDGRRQRFLRS